MKRLTFHALQAIEAQLPPRRDGAEVRAELIAAGVLRPARSLLRQMPVRPGFRIDEVGLGAAAGVIFFRTSAEQLPGIIEHADPRIARRLEALHAATATSDR